MVIDYARHCYKTEAKLWRDRDDLTPITWFRAGDDAELYPGETFMGSLRTWEKGEDNVSYIGERPKTFQYYKGMPPAAYKGDHFCGRPEDFADGGQSGVSEEMTTDDSGAAPCCNAESPVELCGLTLPRTMWAKLFVHSDCSCGDGTVIQLDYRTGLLIYNGVEYSHWWALSTFPSVTTLDWPPPPEVVQLGECETFPPGAGPMYMEVMLGIKCPPFFSRTEVRYYGDPDGLPLGSRIGPTTAEGFTVLSESPWRATSGVSESHMEIGTCNVGTSGGVVREWHVEYFDAPPA